MPKMSDNLLGALLMSGSMAAFTINDAFMKSLSGELPLFEAIFLRGLLTSFLLLLIAWRVGGLNLSMSRRSWSLVLIRSGCEVIAAYFFITALFHMSFANLNAILQVTPLAVTLGAALVFREAVGWRRMLAILIGFLGVLLIVKPGAEGFNSYSTYGVISVVAVTVRDLAARRITSEVPSMTIALIASVLVTVAAGLASIGDAWVQPSPIVWAQLSGAVTFVFAAYIFSVMTMRVGDIGAVAPFRYVGLIFALIIGLLVFGEWPDNLTLLGAAIVVVTGVFTLVRERNLAIHSASTALRQS